MCVTNHNDLAHFVPSSIRNILNANQLATEVQARRMEALRIKLIKI